MPAILRISAHLPARPETAPANQLPAKPPPVAECAAFIRCCRDSLVPLIGRATGVTAKELRILKDLRSEHGDCSAAVARRLSIDDGEMCRLVKRLSARDLLIKGEAKDRRKSALHLTPTGRALVDRSDRAENMVLEARLEELSAEEQEELREAMAVVRELLCGG